MSTERAVRREDGELWIDYVELGALVRWPRNPKGHDGELINALIRRVGYVDPIVVDEKTGEIAAGHGRLDELERMHAAGEPAPYRIKVVRGKWHVPVLRGVSFSDKEEFEIYAVGSNRAVEKGGWENAAIAAVLSDYKPETLAVMGFDSEDLVRFVKGLADGGKQGRTDPDDLGELPKQAVTKPGDLWVLGDHRLLCGETRDPEIVRRVVGGLVLVLEHSDPPYGMGKEAQGVENDNIYDDKLDEFQLAWWRAWLPSLSDVGSAYIWGNAPDLWRLWWRHLHEDEKLLVRNELVWDKGSGFGMRAAGQHSYSPATERCLFLMRGQQFLGNQNKEDFWPGYEPLRSWLDGQREAAGWSSADVNRITETHMAGHWFTQSQFMPISLEHYQALAAAAEGRAFAEPYDALFRRMFPEVRSGGNQHRRDLAAKLREARTHFDNTHDSMTDVWSFPRVHGEERFGHATPKPVAMVARAIRSSSEEGDAVGVPFVGTGPEYVAGEQLGRRVVGVELSPIYCDVVVDRWQNFTGKKAKRSRG